VPLSSHTPYTHTHTHTLPKPDRAGQNIELYRAEGVKFAHAASGNQRWLFVDGRSWEVPSPITPDAAKRVCALLTGGVSPIPSAGVRSLLLQEEEEEGGVGEAIEGLLVELLDSGLLYPLQVGEVFDDEDDEEA
jgi:hypothetical protein